jgi:uncharacterized protein
MDITPAVPQGRQTVSGYGNGGFKLNNVFVEGSLLVFPDKSLKWDITAIDQLTLAALEPVFQADPKVEILLIGAGKHIAFVDAAIRQELRAQGIAIDVLDTGAACRTYNVLMSEERRVAAALIAI